MELKDFRIKEEEELLDVFREVEYLLVMVGPGDAQLEREVKIIHDEIALFREKIDNNSKARIEDKKRWENLLKTELIPTVCPQCNSIADRTATGKDIRN